MTLLKQWQDLIGNQTDATFEEFWEKYSSTETRIYEDILKDKSGKLTGKFSELAEKYEADPVIFMGFLDGISTSVNNELDLENVTTDSELSLDIDFEKLYFNMHKAGADYLYNLPQWDDIYTEEKREEIYDDYRKSRTVVKEKTPGRNDPCPCGSGKKYKKCCGAAV